MSTPDAAAAAAQAAAEKAFLQFTIESWSLYSVAFCVTALRTYARVKAVGFRDLQPSDYLVWVGVLFYTAQLTLAYSIGNLAKGLANNGMTDAQRAELSPGSPEWEFRVIGSKIQVAGWSTYHLLVWSLKLSMLSFYTQLTEGLGRPYRIRIYLGFAIVISTLVACLGTIWLSCMPFHKYWQINPNPGNVCQAAISKPIIWISFASNVSTDIYLICIPLPMLWSSRLRLVKKIAATVVLGAGLFVLVCAMLKSIFVLVDPINGAQLAGEWGTREAFVAVITTNLPMLFPLLKSWLKPFFGNALRSTDKMYKTPTGFRTIGGGGDSKQSRSRGGPPSVNPITGNITTFNESEERIVEDIKMQELKVYATPVSENGRIDQDGIMVSNKVEVTHEDRHNRVEAQYGRPRVPDSW